MHRITHVLSFAAIVALGLACQKDQPAAPKADVPMGATPSDAPKSPEAAPEAAPTRPDAARDPCALLTPADVKAAAGVEGEGKASESGGANVCTWTGPDGKSAVVQIFASEARYDESRQTFEGLYKGTAEDLPGVGDKAFFIGGKTGTMPTATVVFQKGPTPVSAQVMAMEGDPAKLKDEATALARALLAKL